MTIYSCIVLHSVKYERCRVIVSPVLPGTEWKDVTPSKEKESSMHWFFTLIASFVVAIPLGKMLDIHYQRHFLLPNSSLPKKERKGRGKDGGKTMAESHNLTFPGSQQVNGRAQLGGVSANSWAPCPAVHLTLPISRRCFCLMGEDKKRIAMADSSLATSPGKHHQSPVGP